MRRLGWYVGWVGYQNLGDEAMWQLCGERFPDIAWHAYPPSVRIAGDAGTASPALASHENFASRAARIVCEEARSRVRTHAFAADASDWARGRIAGEVAILGGGTVIAGNYIEHYRALRRRTGRSVPVFASGVGDIEFWESRLPAWRDRRREWVDAFAELPIVGVRGPMSKALLQEAGATNVDVTGDPALLLQPSAHIASRSQRVEGRRRVGINLGVTIGGAGTMWGNPDALLQTVAVVARRLVASGVEVELFAVWPPDRRACEAVTALLDDPRITIAPVLSESQGFMNYVRRRYDVVVAFKLHAGVLAAAAGVPMIVLEYRPKCEDFARSIDWDAFSRRTDIVDADWLEDGVRSLLADLPAACAKLDNTITGIRTRLATYCDQIAVMLA